MGSKADPSNFMTHDCNGKCHQVELLQESLNSIIRAAGFVVAVAKQERHKSIRLDSMVRALAEWDKALLKHYEIFETGK